MASPAHRTSSLALALTSPLSTSPLSITTIVAATIAATLAPAALPSAQAAPSRYAPGTSISASQSQQVLVADRTSGTRGTWARYEWRGNATGWVRVNGTSAAVFGKGGVVSGTIRKQGTDTTPAGTYSLKYAFGAGNPGTRMGYRQIGSCSYWVQSNESDYNRWRESCATPPRSGERLASYAGRLYRQAVVIGYNYDRPVYGKGAGIFLHYATTYTGGCVGLTSMTELTRTVQWLDPRKSPLIVIKA